MKSKYVLTLSLMLSCIAGLMFNPYLHEGVFADNPVPDAPTNQVTYNTAINELTTSWTAPSPPPGTTISGFYLKRNNDFQPFSVTSTNLTNYFRLDGNNTALRDIGTMDANTTVIGNLNFTTSGRIAGAFNFFNGSTTTESSFFAGKVGDMKFLHNGSKWSINLWVKRDDISTPTSGNQKYVLGTADASFASAGISAFVPTNDGTGLQFEMHDCLSNRILLKSTSVFPNTNWQMVTFTFDPSLGSNQLTVYKNSTLDASASLTGTQGTCDSAFPLTFGNTGDPTIRGIATNVEFKGNMDEIRIYKDRVLSSTELTDLYNYALTTSSPLTDSGLTMGTAYSYVVGAVNEYGMGANATSSDTTGWVYTVIAKKADNSTNVSGSVIQSNSTDSKTITLSSGQATPFLVFGNQNTTIKDSVGMVIYKDLNRNISANTTKQFATYDFFVDCPSNGVGNDVEITTNDTDGHIGTSTTPTCNSSNQVSWDFTYTAGGINPNSFNSIVKAKILNTTAFGANATLFTVNGTSQSTTYSSPTITSSTISIGTGLQTVTKTYVLTLKTVPTAPTSLSTTTISSSQINLAWTAPSGTVTGYKIERQTHTSNGCSGGSWITLVADTGTTTTSFPNSGLSAFTCYSYRVSALNSGDASSPSTVALGTTSPYPNIISIGADWNTISVGSGMAISDTDLDGIGDVIYTRSGSTLTKQFGSSGVSSFSITNNSPDLLYVKENRILAKSNTTNSCDTFVATQWNITSGSSINTLTGIQSSTGIEAYAGIINTNDQTGILCAKTSANSDWNLLIHDTPDVNSTASNQAFNLTVINGGPYHLGFASSSGLNKAYTYENTFYTNSTVSNTKYVSKTSDNTLEFDTAFILPSNVYVDNNIDLYSNGLDYPERTIMTETTLKERLAIPVNNTITSITNLPPRILHDSFTSAPVYLLINNGTSTYFGALIGTNLYYTDYDLLLQQVALNRAFAHYRIDPTAVFLTTEIEDALPTTSISVSWRNGTSTTYNAPPQLLLTSGYYIQIPGLSRNYYPDYTNSFTYMPFGSIEGSFSTMSIVVSVAPQNSAIMISNSSKYNNENNYVDHVTLLEADRSWSGSIRVDACHIISIKDTSERTNPWIELGTLCNSGAMPKTIAYTTSLPLTFWTLQYGASHTYNQTTNSLTTLVRSATTPFTYQVIIKNNTGGIVIDETHNVNGTLDLNSYNISSIAKPASLSVLVGGSQIYSAFLGSSISLASVASFFHQYFSYGGFDLIAFLPIIFAAMFTRNTVGIGTVMTVVCVATISWLSIVVIPDTYIFIMAIVAILSLIGYRLAYPN